MKECVTCSAPITGKGKTGLCHRCQTARINSCPEVKRRRREAIRRKFQDPEHRARMARVVAKNLAGALSRPEYRAALVERGHELTRILHSPEVKERSRQARARAGKSISETRLGWCPPEYRDYYRKLTISKRLLAADAKAATLRKIEQDRHAAIARERLDDARHFLSRFTSVRPAGDAWIYGTVKTDAAGIVERALQKGWQP